METGLTYTSTVVVSKENVAATMGSGDLNVFATPAMVALMENAAMSAVQMSCLRFHYSRGHDEHYSYQALGCGRHGFGYCRIKRGGRQKTYF